MEFTVPKEGRHIWSLTHKPRSNSQGIQSWEWLYKENVQEKGLSVCPGSTELSLNSISYHKLYPGTEKKAISRKTGEIQTRPRIGSTNKPMLVSFLGKCSMAM